MSGIQFIRLFLRNIKLIIGVAISLSLIVAELTKGEKLSYSSSAMINTGIISGYNPESSASSKIDREYVLTEIDNLLQIAKSFATKEELTTTLLTEILMMKEADKYQILDQNFQELHEEIPQNVWDSLIDYRSFERSYRNICQYRDHSIDNPIYEIIYSKHPLFGIEQLSTLKVTRVGRSDMLKFTYTTLDPGICQRTLELIIAILARKHKEVKESQSANVLGFFQQQTKLSADRLKRAEDALKIFREDSRIINYYEQTRFISSKKEELSETYQQEYQKLVAAKAIIKRLEGQMSKRLDLAQLHQQIQAQRDSLENLTQAFTYFELFSPTDEQEIQQKRTLATKISRLKVAIAQTQASTYEIEISPEGVALGDMMTEWLKNIIIIEETMARMAVIEEQKSEFASIYEQFAPLGSQLTRLERAITVAEKEYLENLHSKNQAQLHKQSIMMATNLKIVDHPLYASEPNGSQRKMLIAVAGLAGFVLTLALIIALEFFDNTLKTPRNIQKVIHLELIGALPKFPPDRKAYKTFLRKLLFMDHGQSKIDFESIKDLSIGLLLQHVQINFFKTETYSPQKLFIIMSMREAEGKSFLASLLSERLRMYGEKVLYLLPRLSYHSEDLIRSNGSSELESLLEAHEDNIAYQVSPAFFEMNHITELPLEEELNWEYYSYILMELPPILKHPFSTPLIASADLSMLVCRANRVWNQADQKLLDKVLEGIDRAPGMILNGTREENLETIIGEIPKKRSRFRKFIKKLISFRLKEKKGL